MRLGKAAGVSKYWRLLGVQKPTAARLVARCREGLDHCLDLVATD